MSRHDRSPGRAALVLAGALCAGACATSPPAPPPASGDVRVTIVDGIGSCRYRGRAGCVRLRIRNDGTTPLTLAIYGDNDDGPMLYPYDVRVQLRGGDGAWQDAETANATDYPAYDSLVVLKPGRSAFATYFQDHVIPPGATYRVVLRALDNETSYFSAPASAARRRGD